jgi:hypothetical protein
MDLVDPGDHERSLLYLKLAAKTLEESLPEGVTGDPMPFGEQLPALTEDELEVLKIWIRGGAGGDTVMKGTEGLLGCTHPVAVDPNKIDPLPALAPNEGVQFYSGAWALGAESEDEVCYATYYDFSDRIPDSARIPCPANWGADRECFTYGTSELAQDAQSHHSVITAYTADMDPNGPEWGPWTCLGGANAGTPCDPTAADTCGERSRCTTPATTSLACLGYDGAPSDFAVGLGPNGDTDVPGCETPEDCGTGPLQIALSGAQESTYVTRTTAGVYTVIPVNGFVSWNSHGFNLTSKETTIEQWVNIEFVRSEDRQWQRRYLLAADRVFAMSPVSPFEKREVCMTFTLPQFARVMNVNSHMHQRGELFRIWAPPHTACAGGSIFSEDLDCSAPSDDPMYLSRAYNDAVNLEFDPPLAGLDDEEGSTRTFKACAVFDNGADAPLEVKRNSRSLNQQNCEESFARCGCDVDVRACFGGPNQGMLCDGDDSVCGDGGLCDACPLVGGTTTESEMFVPFGNYYVDAPE